MSGKEVFVSSRFMSGVTKKPTGVVARPATARQSVGGSQRAPAVEKWSDASQSIDDDAASFQNLLGPSFGRPSSAASTPQRMSLPSALPSQSPARTPVRSRVSDVSSRSTVTPSRSDPLVTPVRAKPVTASTSAAASAAAKMAASRSTTIGSAAVQSASRSTVVTRHRVSDVGLVSSAISSTQTPSRASLGGSVARTSTTSSVIRTRQSVGGTAAVVAPAPATQSNAADIDEDDATDLHLFSVFGSAAPDMHVPSLVHAPVLQQSSALLTPVSARSGRSSVTTPKTPATPATPSSRLSISSTPSSAVRRLSTSVTRPSLSQSSSTASLRSDRSSSVSRPSTSKPAVASARKPTQPDSRASSISRSSSVSRSSSISRTSSSVVRSTSVSRNSSRPASPARAAAARAVVQPAQAVKTTVVTSKVQSRGGVMSRASVVAAQPTKSAEDASDPDNLKLQLSHLLKSVPSTPSSRLSLSSTPSSKQRPSSAASPTPQRPSGVLASATKPANRPATVSAPTPTSAPALTVANVPSVGGSSVEQWRETIDYLRCVLYQWLTIRTKGAACAHEHRRKALGRMTEVAAMCDELDAEASAMELETLRLQCVCSFDRLLSPQYDVIAPLWPSLRKMSIAHHKLFVALQRSMLKLPTESIVASSAPLAVELRRSLEILSLLEHEASSLSHSLGDISANMSALAALIRAEVTSLNSVRDTLLVQMRSATRARSLAVECIQGLESQRQAVSVV